MEIKKIRLVYYSPTGTTRRILQGVGEGTNLPIQAVDVTPHSATRAHSMEFGDELVVIGAPVYGGRLPRVAVERLSQMTGLNTPTVLVAVYGNRAYSGSLKELEMLATERGFVPVAAGAFIGEHSFSCRDIPLAPGRPDESDLAQARRLGRMVMHKLGDAPALGHIQLKDIPGDYPDSPRPDRAWVPPSVDESLCLRCDQCLDACPTVAAGAAFGEASTVSCTLCSACIRVCPQGARSFTGDTAGFVSKAAAWLSSSCSSRKEPELFV